LLQSAGLAIRFFQIILKLGENPVVFAGLTDSTCHALQS
jgi:hypothetical protein